MGCTHEIKSGSVVTVVNAGGIRSGCSFCKQEALEKENVALRNALANIRDLGHNDDCIFCGLKDREAKRASELPGPGQAKP